MPRQPPSLPLERLLYDQCGNRELFPDKLHDYCERYLQIKEWLAANVYRDIGAATSRDGGIYTCHDINHFEAVIRTAGKLIGLDAGGSQNSPLHPYEVYLLLMGILLHDAGNVYGRKDHEKQPYKILLEMGELAGGDDLEKKRIANIAQAHGGKIADDKDTIVRLCKDINSYLSISYRERLIAAIVRFADEICEDRSRASRFLAETSGLPDESEIHHKYALSISSVDIERSACVIQIKYSVSTEDLRKRYMHPNCQDGLYLIDYIMQRLAKMHLEHLYCLRFMKEVVPITRIDINIEILDANNDSIEEIHLRLEESGYPKMEKRLAERYPEVTGEKMMLKYQVRDEQL